jgi:hypothetical protein
MSQILCTFPGSRRQSPRHSSLTVESVIEQLHSALKESSLEPLQCPRAEVTSHSVLHMRDPRGATEQGPA